MRNKVRLEGSIAEAYVATECVIFCSMYLDDIERRFNHSDRNADREWGDNEPTCLYLNKQFDLLVQGDINLWT